MVYYGDPVHTYEGWNVKNEIGKLWARFKKLWEEHSELLEKHIKEPNIAYEAHIAYAGHPNQEYHIFVGVETDGPIEYPIELFYKEMPSTRYAIFTCKGEDIPSQIEQIFTEWLPNGSYEESYPMLIQRYDNERFRELDDPESEIDFMVPVRKKLDER